MGSPAPASRALNPANGYQRHSPEKRALYRLIATLWADFLERSEEFGGLPAFVTREIDAYLRCGILEHGFLQLVCRNCGHSQLVAFSCKKRGFCPSCLGRRMTDTAVHLVESVLPPVPIRHWICSLPWDLRALLDYENELCSEVLDAFVTELSSHLRRKRNSFSALPAFQTRRPAQSLQSRGVIRPCASMCTFMCSHSMVSTCKFALASRSLPIYRHPRTRR